MTTIAYRDGNLAADTQISYTNIRNGWNSKVTLCGDYLVGMAGTAVLRRPLEEWVRGGAAFEDIPNVLLENQSNFNALFLNSKNELFEFDSGFLQPVHAHYLAIGSGGTLAMGALAHGATAKEAVEAAIKHDKNSGGNVTVHHYTLIPE